MTLGIDRYSRIAVVAAIMVWGNTPRSPSMHSMMNEQYAFAIAFDQQPSDTDGDGGLSHADWPMTLSQIEELLETKGFPSFSQPRWEEFGEGRIFWGTKDECEALKSVLSSLAVSLYEERNLDPGYYSSPAGFYAVNDEGEILGLESTPETLNSTAVSALESIPMDAYRTQQLASEVETKFQQAVSQSAPQLQAVIGTALHTELLPQPDSGETFVLDETVEVQLEAQTKKISALEQQIHDLKLKLRASQSESSAKVDPEVAASLRQQIEMQTSQIQECERVMEQHQAHVHDLQLMLDRKVEPELHSQLQQQVAAQTEQMSELEQELGQLKQSYADILASESQRISAEDYERLGKVSTEQSQTIAGLESQVQGLQLALKEAQQHLEDKVDRERFQTLQSEKDLQVTLIKELEQKAIGLEARCQEMTLQHEDQHKMIQDLEQKNVSLESEYQRVRSEVAQKIDLQDYQAVQADANQFKQNAEAQADQLAQSEVELVALRQELANWMQIANEKVERSDYEAALAQIQRMQAKLSRSWLERLRDWVRGKS